MRRRVLVAPLIGAAVAGCGSLSLHELPPAAEPAPSPSLADRPAGRVVAVGREPEGVAADPRTHVVAVGLRGQAPALVLVDGATGRVRRRVALPASPRHVQFDGARRAFLVPAEGADRLLGVSPGGRTVLDAATGAHPHDATAAAGRTFVGDERGDRTTVLDRAGRPVGVLRGAIQPGGVAAVLGSRAVAVVSVRERVLELWDVRTLRRLGRVPVGVGPTHVVAAGGAFAYVADTAGDALLVVRLRPVLRVTRRYALRGSPYGLAVDPGRRRLWVTTTADNGLHELVADRRPHVLRSYAAVRQPDTVAVDSATGRVFVTGRAAGVLQLLDP